MRRGNALVVILVILVIVGAAAFLLMQTSAGLVAKVPDYKNMHDRYRGEGPTGAKPPTPVVVVDYMNSHLDTLQDRLRAGMRATNDGEVKSIVILERHSTGMPGATVPGLAVASSNKGSYSIAAFIYDRNGELLQTHSASRESAMSGAGFEAELRPKVEQDILDWLIEQLE